MNTGSNRVKNAYASIAAAAISALVSTTVLAAPKQLDILGLVPGVSEITQVQQADANQKSDFSTNDLVTLEVGGHKMPCAPFFLDGKLASLNCFTGKSALGQRWTKASNVTVHSDLTAGFTKKFGKPALNTAVLRRTGIGVEYNQRLVSWEDKLGNRLVLMSIIDTVDQGIVYLESSEYLKQEAAKDAEMERQKKF